MSDLPGLLALCSDSRQPNDRTDFRSSRIYAVMEDPFTLWCSFHAPREQAVQENSTYEADKSRREHEIRSRWAAEHFPGFVAVENVRGAEALALTLKYMSEGRPAIQYPALWFLKEHIYGKANMIVRSDSAPSVFGDYHYTLVQFKQALEIKRHYSVQGALLNKILGLMQGCQPQEFRIFLRNGRELSMRHADWAPELEQTLDVWGAIRDNILQPEPAKPPNAAAAPWRVFANRLVSERKDLILLAGVSREWRQKLRDNGILTTTQAAVAGPQKLKELTDESAGADIFGNAAANELNAPVLRGDKPMSLPQRARNLYFDFENADAITPDAKPYVYLIGVWDAETGKYTALLARSQREEEKIFRDFSELVGDPAQALLYHWTEHEAHHIKLAANDYPAISSAMRGLLSACCDLKKAVQKAFYLPAPSFSLKAAAPAFGFNWRQHECGAMDSMAYYWDWISNNNEDAIKKVLVYNEDDCLAMHHIHRRLAQDGHFSMAQALEKINSGRTS